MQERGQRSLWRLRDFQLLIAGQSATQLGTEVTAIAFPLTAILLLDATPFELGILVAIQNSAFLIFGLPVGVWLDRRRIKPVLIVTDVVRCLALVTITVTAALSELTLGLLMAMAGVMSIMRVVFEVGYQSYLPSVVHRTELVQGNSAVEVIRSSGQIAGPGIGGWLTQLIGAANALVADAVSFVVSAVCLWRIRVHEERPARTQQRGAIREAREGLVFVLTSPVLRAVAATSAVSNLLFVAATALIILFLVDTVGFSPGSAGMLMSAGAAATVIGAMLATPLARRAGSARIIWLSLLITSPFNLLVPLTENDWRAVFFVVAITVSGAGQIIYNITQISYRQMVVPVAILSRVNATMRFLVMGALPLGGLLGGALGSTVGVRPTLVIIGCGLALAPIPLLLSPLGRVRDIDELAQVDIDPLPTPGLP